MFRSTPILRTASHDDPDDVAENVRLCVETGVAGLSIEDFTGNDSDPLYPFDLAVARVRAARKAVDAAGGAVVFTARTEGFIKNRPDMAETIRRLKAFADEGADCLYPPGIKTREQIETVVQAVAPKPVNLLMSAASGLTVKDIAGMGVRRISVGGTLARIGHARISQVGARDRRARHVRQLRRRDNECRTEQIFPRRPAAPAKVVTHPTE